MLWQCLISDCVCVGGWAGERAAVGDGSALRGEDQKSQHGSDQLSSRISNHTHHSVAHLHSVASSTQRSSHTPRILFTIKQQRDVHLKTALWHVSRWFCWTLLRHLKHFHFLLQSKCRKYTLALCDFTQTFPKSQSPYWTALMRCYRNKTACAWISNVWHEVFVSMNWVKL